MGTDISPLLHECVAYRNEVRELTDEIRGVEFATTDEEFAEVYRDLWEEEALGIPNTHSNHHPDIRTRFRKTIPKCRGLLTCIEKALVARDATAAPQDRLLPDFRKLAPALEEIVTVERIDDLIELLRRAAFEVPDPEHLLRGKYTVNVRTAALYLDRSREHVRRLVRTGALERDGQVRPKQIKTESLRKYKHTLSPSTKTRA